MVALDFVIPKAILKGWFKTQVILAPMTPEQIELVVRRLMALGALRRVFVLASWALAGLRSAGDVVFVDGYWSAPKGAVRDLGFLSGRGRIATLASRAGFACAATDMAVDKDKRGQRCRLKASRSFRSVMDWNGDSGFATFGGTSPRASVQPRLVVLLCLRAT